VLQQLKKKVKVGLQKNYQEIKIYLKGFNILINV
jgi:hypothetical protein